MLTLVRPIVVVSQVWDGNLSMRYQPLPKCM